MSGGGDVKGDTKISDEMKEISAEGRQWAREAGYSIEHLRDFFGDNWFDGASQADRLNNIGLKEATENIETIEEFLSKIKIEIDNARKQLRWDAKEIYATDLSDRVKDLLVDAGYRRRLDVYYCAAFDLLRIEGFGKVALAEWKDWGERYNKAGSYESDSAEATKRYEELLAEIRARNELRQLEEAGA